MKVRIFGHTYDMGGLTGVGTYLEYSGQGLMHKLLLYQSLANMRSRGAIHLLSVSLLHPLLPAQGLGDHLPTRSRF